MKRIISVFITVAMIAGIFSGCGNSGNIKSSSASDGGSYKWRMALNSTPGDNAYDVGALFAEKIGELSDGQIKVELYGGASLGSTSEVLEGMSDGVADVCVEAIGALAALERKANIDAIPYIYSGYDHFTAVWQGELGKEMLSAIGDGANKKLLGATYRGPRVVTATKPMSKIDDFAGFKLRTPNLDVYLKTWHWMKATPTPIAMNEVYTALQQNTVEGQENPLTDNLIYGFDETCKYWIRTDHVYSCNTIIMDLNYFNSLPADIQAMVEEAATYATIEISKQQLERDSKATDKVLAANCEIIEVDREAFAEYFDGFTEENFPDLLDWVERIRALDTNQ